MTPAAAADLKDFVKRNRAAYARIAAEWAARRDREFDHDFHERCRMLFLSHLKGEEILDAGCGLGLDSRSFAAAGFKVTAADIVAEFLAPLSAAVPPIRTVVMDLAAPCFREASFDGIFACASFLHVPRGLDQEALAALAQTLRPQGVLFINHVASRLGLHAYRVDDLLVKDNPAFCFCHGEEEFVGMLELAGLEVVAMHHERPLRRPSPCAERYQLAPYQVVARKP